MGILQIILLTVAALIIALLIVGLFTKKSYTLERIIDIDLPQHDVFNFIKYLKNQDHYNKWVMLDPQMKKTFLGRDGSSGFIYAWESSKAGTGEQEITNVIDDRRIDTEVRFKKPFKGFAQTYFETSNENSKVGVQNSTRVRWVFGSRLNYPINLILLFMKMDRHVGKDMETSLFNLKSVLENKQ